MQQPMTTSCQRPAPVGGRPWLRLAVMGLVLLGSALGLMAQSYQTSFSSVKFDRAKGPATFSAGVEVDAASGAASMEIPFGPGIGERGLKFRPVLSMRMAPQFGISTMDEHLLLYTTDVGIQHWGTQTLDTLYQRGFGTTSFHPGTLDLGARSYPGSSYQQTTYSLPGGGGGRVLGKIPTGVNRSTVQALLPKFGFSASDTVGYLQGPTSIPLGSRTDAIQMGSSGHLVVGLRSAGPVDPLTGTTDEACVDIQSYPATPYRWHFPKRVLVIQGDVAYEFHYGGPYYQTQVIPYLAISEKNQLVSGGYHLATIRNKFGEHIDFTYDLGSGGIGYTVTWSTNPALKIRVEVVGPVSVPGGQPSLLRNDLQIQDATQIRVSYQGVSQPVSSYLLEIAGAEVTGSEPNSPASNTATSSVQPIRIVQEATNEEIRFNYGTGPAITWTNVTLSPTVLKSVTFPTRTVELTWEPYRYRMNYSPEAWGGVVSSTLPGRPAIAYGVIGISDTDGTGGRGIGHRRVVPKSNWSTGPVQSDEWVDTTFYDAITHPDGTVSLHRFVDPQSSDGSIGSGIMQDLAFIKTLEREVRYYAPGVDWHSDLSATSPASSTAYKWVVKDRFDVRTVGSPSGDMGNQSVPYPTRVRSWDKESQILTTEETTDWDSVAAGWKATHTTSSITATPSLAVEYLSLAQQGRTYSPYPTTLGLYRRTNKTFEPKASEWIFARVKTEQTTTVTDNTGSLASGVTLPAAQPLLTKTFHADINRVESVALSNGGAPTLTTAFTFQGTSGLAATELLSAYLSSPGLGLSGVMGVSAYGYDANGYLNAISQKPNAGTTLTGSQTSDELGRPMTQTDLNGRITTFDWDQAGRLSSISSVGEVPTTIQYNDADHRGITVTRGAQVSGFRYNGFGQLILENRTAPNGTLSHRIHGYDQAGRKTGETVWLAGDGAAHEGDWVKHNLLLTTTTTVSIEETMVCQSWVLDEDGNGTCVSWRTSPARTTTITNPALYAGVVTKYDYRGRVILTQDANLAKTSIEYSGPGNIRKISVLGNAPQVKWFVSDAAGRLTRVTTPVTRYGNPLTHTSPTLCNLQTQYFYDAGDRIKMVKQTDEAGRVQTRTWDYTPMGWLKSLGQPESGTTTYDGFTVAGAPTITSYNGRIVRMTPDWMGRPVTVTSDDGTVSQTFAYDTALNGKGQLARSTDSGVTTAYRYGGVGNRLDQLATTATVQGVNTPFTQNFSYDLYGNRISGNTSHSTWTQSFHLAAGLPNVLSYGTKKVTETPWTSYDSVGWMVKQIKYGNNTLSDFSYGADQARLAQITHRPLSGTSFAQWAYTYDDAGNLVREDDKLTGGFDQYGYDELNRLISAVIQSPTYGEQLQQFDYDAFGNRTSSNLLKVTGWSGEKGKTTAYTTTSGLLLTPGNQVVNATFTKGDANLMKNRIPVLTSTGVTTGAEYDAQGNLTEIYEKPTSINPVVLRMTYDALGRVLTLSSTKTLITEKYQYTPEGLRTVIQEYSGATLQNTRVNIYNDARQMVSQYEKTPTGVLTWKRDIVYLGAREAAEFDSAGMHVTQVDHLGSPRVVTGPTGQIESKQKYLPFGERLEQSGTFKSAKGYTNHEQTDASGLIYMQARFYLPQYGRFASPDPARDQHFEQTQSWNIYSYVRNNPVMSTDPTGMEKEDKQTGPGTANAITEAMSATVDHSWQMQNDVKERAREAQTSAKGAAASVGAQATTDAAARAKYHSLTKGLQKGSPGASAARTAAKVLARSESSPAGAIIAETMRPMAAEGSRVGGSVASTNASVDAAMGVAGKAGPALLGVGVAISVYNVANAAEGQGFRTAAGESGAWAGAISFGTAGAQGGAAIGASVGAFFGGVGAVPGAAIGGIIGGIGGGIAGAFAGQKAATNMYDAVND